MKFDFNNYLKTENTNKQLDRSKTGLYFYEFSKKARAVVNINHLEYKNGQKEDSMEVRMLIEKKFNKVLNIYNPELMEKLDLNSLFENLTALSYVYKSAPLFKDQKFKDKVAALSANIDSLAKGEKISKTAEEILGPVDMQIAIELADKHYSKAMDNYISSDYTEYDC